MIKLEQLKALDAVVRGGSFAKAANEILLVTQPAVTRSIQNLEETLGFSLFNRENYRPELTPQGKSFYQKALKILQEVEELTIFSAQLATGHEPEIKIAIDAYVLVPPVLKALHHIHQVYPATQLHLSCELVGASIFKLLAREADVALLMWQPEYKRYPIETKIIQKLRASTVVAPTFPLLTKKGIVKKEELIPYIQVIERTAPNHDPIVTQLNPQDGHFWYVSDAHAKKQIILSGNSFGLLPYHLIEEELKQGFLVPFENLEGFQVYETHMKAARLKGRTAGPVLQELWDKLS